MNCKDCGGPLGSGSRMSMRICADCLSLRTSIIKARETGRISQHDFERMQRAFSTHRGTAAKEARTLLANVEWPR